ncbi:MAG: ribose 5-phosphate isomerase B [Acidobacteria bacterium]|nr:ribose 5-phosphate isomerase B [Acidobacteriota bacterium]
MILIASDHAAFEMKQHLVTFLKEMQHEVDDLGVRQVESVDYPDFAHRLAEGVGRGDGVQGILICGTGLGMSMAANRHAGIRAALCHDAYTAAMARKHNDANVLCIGARVLGIGVAEQIVRVFLSTPFEGGRHQRRVDKIEI